MTNKSMLLAAILVFLLALMPVMTAQQPPSAAVVSGADVTVPVTVHPHNDRTRALAAKLQPQDFVVHEDKRPQQILSVRRPTEAPPIIEILIQDDLVSRVNNEINGIKQFIRALPEGSRVMVGYITNGSLSVPQDFTMNRERAAGALRIVRSSQSGSPFSPYEQVVDALRRFDSQPTGRRTVLLISDGLDVSRGFQSASPFLAVDLERAIREAQRRGVAVFVFYAPSIGLTSVSRLATNFGQGSLNRLADETGGMAFFSGTDFVTFDPYFKELRDLLGRQWLITYRSTNTARGFRRIEVVTEPGEIHLHYPTGYEPKR